MSRPLPPSPLGSAALAARDLRFGLFHVAANAVLLAMAYAWLWVPEARIWQLTLSALLALATAGLGLWLLAATVWYFRARHRGEEARLRAAFSTTLARVPALACWLAFFLFALWMVSRLESAAEGWAGVTASWLTMKRQEPVSPASVHTVYLWVIWALRWVVAPLMFLPVAARVALHGFRAFRLSSVARAWRIFLRPPVLAVYVLLLMCGYFLPRLLTGWVPPASGLALEAASMAARVGVAYLLVTASWLALLSLLAGLAAEDEAPR